MDVVDELDNRPEGEGRGPKPCVNTYTLPPLGTKKQKGQMNWIF
jgi:hypothetical protein